MTLLLIRHGQTQWNVQRRLQGWLDSPLTAEAKLQLATQPLPALNNPLIYSSDLGRTQASTQIIAKRTSAKIMIDKRLRERKFGVLQGQVIDQDPHLAGYWQQYHERYLRPLKNIPGVESEGDFANRIISFYQEVISSSLEQDIIIVSHGEWLRGFNNLINGASVWLQGNGIPNNAQLVTFHSLKNKNNGNIND